jgi:hypothetical protein
MSEPSVAESRSLVQPCATCGRFEATLSAPPDGDSDEETPICEACADVGQLWRHCAPVPQQTERRAFVWVDLECLELVRPGLTAVEFCTYLAAIQLCDGHRALCSLNKLSAAAHVARRNVVDAVDLLVRVGLLVKAGSYGWRGTRYLVVRPGLIGADPERPGLIRPAVYQEARGALVVLGRIRPEAQNGASGSPLRGATVREDHQASDPGITTASDPGITVAPYYDPKGIQQTNQHSGGSPTHPPSGRNGAPAPCSIFEQAAESAAGDWDDYSLHVLTDQAIRLAGWAEQAAESVTAEQLAGFLRAGASQDWLRRGAERSDKPIASTLHVWCDRNRFLRWLRESNRAAGRRAERAQQEHNRTLPPQERRRLAQQALAELERMTREEGN